MGELSTYKTLEEKEKIFSVVNFETKSQVDDFLNNLETNKKYIWRGSAQANHKLYTSLQRFWIINDMANQNENVEEYLNYVCKEALLWHGGLFKRYIENISGDKHPSIFSILSVLRHHGTATPYTDWTRNPLIALFFGSEGKARESSNQIENYFSLYAISEDHTFVKMSAKDYSYNPKEMEYIHKTIQEESINKVEFAELLGVSVEELNNKILVRKQLSVPALFKYSTSTEHAAVFRIEDFPGDEFSWGVNNNLNIINQEGLFLFNIHPTKPLEETIGLLMEHYAIKGTNTPNIPKEVRDKKVEEINKGIICYNFHKRLSTYIKNELRKYKPKITQDYLFPSFNDLSSFTQNSYMEKKQK
ncbi:MAG: FRG domain-containing protein [Bacteroidetes bacterium]|nr:FRG domain-containing protein [Bacteroidota bacterium]